MEGPYLEIKINREIRNYTESMFFGLSMRQFSCAAAAVGIAVAKAAAAEGLAEVELSDPVQQVHEAMWRPEYPRLEIKPL